MNYSFCFFFYLGSLHDALMELQQNQLKQLSDWLTLTEERIRKMESQRLVEDLETFQHQMDEHKVFLSLPIIKTIGGNLLTL